MEAFGSSIDGDEEDKPRITGPADLFRADLKYEIAAFCKLVGVRPSSLFEWDDPADYMARIKFDIDMMSALKGGGSNG